MKAPQRNYVTAVCANIRLFAIYHIPRLHRAANVAYKKLIIPNEISPSTRGGVTLMLPFSLFPSFSILTLFLSLSLFFSLERARQRITPFFSEANSLLSAFEEPTMALRPERLGRTVRIFRLAHFLGDIRPGPPDRPAVESARGHVTAVEQAVRPFVEWAQGQCQWVSRANRTAAWSKVSPNSHTT